MAAVPTAVLVAMATFFALVMLVILRPTHIRLSGVGEASDISISILVKPPFLPRYVAVPARLFPPLQSQAPRRPEEGDRGTSRGHEHGDGLSRQQLHRLPRKKPHRQPRQHLHGQPGQSSSEPLHQQSHEPSWLRGLAPSITVARKYLARNRRFLERAMKEGSQVIAVDEVAILARVGAGDAGSTALLVGGLRALSGVGLSLLSRTGTLLKNKPQLRFTPIYDRAHIAFDISLGISVKPWRALVAAARLYREWHSVSKRD